MPAVILIICIIIQFLQVSQLQLYAATVSSVILDSYEISAGQCSPGQEATIKINLKNIGSTEPIEGIIVTYSTSTQDIYPVFGQSNQEYIESIDPGEVESVEFRVVISDTCQSANLAMAFSLNYSKIYANGQMKDDKNQLYITIPISYSDEEDKTYSDIQTVLTLEQGENTSYISSYTIMGGAGLIIIIVLLTVLIKAAKSRGKT